MTEREKAALELTDHIMAYHGQLPEELYQKVKLHFTDQEIIALFWQIGSKNAANWFLIAMQIEQSK
ncbi:carboxymuconolactone decarboxylase family protein [Ammoniphilus sp. 3BR4]|uniref:carboxymuconolactone decarboxylase family protein n=1 Tax=Ammoniphilus sp. 3BR4 TaxID=3158265 RepID=UPI003465B251